MNHQYCKFCVILDRKSSDLVTVSRIVLDESMISSGSFY